MPDTQQEVSMTRSGLATPRSLFFAIFAVSGFSGLIYESIWSHYLKLFLGHAAYAQSLVLIIFMGGMAMGSWLASRFSASKRSPLLIYAGVELVVGIAALLFHDLFTAMISTFYSTVLPSMSIPALGALLKWLAASLLIMPQSILLGMTFPLMSAGIIRRFPGTPGGSIAMLYFTNSIGAAIGVLASGFWLIKLVGLPGTILTAGLVNILLATVVFLLVRLDPAPSMPAIKREPQADSTAALKRLFLIAAFITGAASFIYEISWIRMLSLVLGATTHSFELMLSAFITGLALGGLWIKRRIDTIDAPVRFSGYVQLIMGILALITIPVYAASFGWMEWLLAALNTNSAGYAGYNIVSHVVALAIMLPTTFMAGMTLPLFTYVLIKEGHGEASIGQVYAANTVGAIVGVMVAVHIGLPILGLKGLIMFGALLDIGLGLVLLSREVDERQRAWRLGGGAIVAAGVFILTVTIVDLDRKLLVSGVYRTGRADLAADQQILFYQDGKTASVSLHMSPDGMVVLATNGKPDASIQSNTASPYSSDEVTMVVAGTLPLAFMPKAEKIANIGMGSGLTTHALLGNERIRLIDTIEIESSMVAAASGYGEFVERAFKDQRSNIHIEDAKTFFSLHNSVYDIIIAEPSNPWVSGVASLFSTEFYSTVKKHLKDDGLFVQWIQLYEFSDQLAESILKALSENFSDYVIYTTDGANILLIAINEGELPEPDWSALFDSGMAADLAMLDINNESDMEVRKLLDRDSLLPYLQQSRVPANSDYFPYVDLNAGRARYVKSQAMMFHHWAAAPLPMTEMLAGDRLSYDELTSAPLWIRPQTIQNTNWIYRRLVENVTVDELGESGRFMPNQLILLTDLISSSLKTCDSDEDTQRWLFSVHELMEIALPHIDGERGAALVDTIAGAECAAQREPVIALWMDFYRGVARRDAGMMSAGARQLLEHPSVVETFLLDYLLGAALLGDIAQNKGGSARTTWEFWDQQRPAELRLPGYLRLLSRIAEAAEN